MNDIQHQTDMDQAKAKLEQVQELKNARTDPRGGELIPPPERRVPATDDEKNIRGVTAKPKKKKFGKKLKEALFGEDIGNGSVSDYVFFRVFVPKLKEMLSTMANTAINMALGLDPKTRTVGNTHAANARTYNDRALDRNYSRQTYGSDSGRRLAISEYEWDEETARDIYTQIEELMEHYPDVSVANVYSIMNMPEKIRTSDRYWGWTTMRGIELVQVDNNSWYIDMPPARQLSR